MSQVSVTLNGKALQLVFNIKMLTRLGRALGLNTLEEVTLKLNVLSTLEQGASIEAIELLWLLIYHAVTSVPGQENAITMEEVENLNQADLTGIGGALTAGLAQAFPPENPEAVETTEETATQEKKS